MEANKLIKIAGGALTLLGTLHLLAHFMGPGGEEVPEVIRMMEDFKIEMMGTHSLMSFHNGFSIMTGLFMITIGVFLIVHASKIDRSMLQTLMFFTLIAFAVALLYFHPLAYGLLLIGFVCQLIALRKFHK